MQVVTVDLYVYSDNEDAAYNIAKSALDNLTDSGGQIASYDITDVTERAIHNGSIHSQR
jgi:formylmethanofuran:tetrahydromethanopterin formyltransferase